MHDPAKVLLDLALTLALGGDTCSDLAVVRAEPAVFGLVASDPTLSRTIARLAADVEKVLPAIDQARADARSRVWAAAGPHAPDDGVDARAPLVVDVDGMRITAFATNTPRGQLPDLELRHRRRARSGRRTWLHLSTRSPWAALTLTGLQRLADLAPG